MQDFATETAPSKQMVPATSAANSCCTGSSSLAARAASQAAAVTDSLVSSISAQRCLIAWNAADLLAELLAHPGVLDGGVEAPAGDAGGLGGGEGDHERPQPLRGEAGDHRRLELGHVADGGTTGQVRRGARGQVGLLERDQQHLVAANAQSVGGTGRVVDQAVGTQRERHPHLPRRNGTGQLPQRHGCHRRAEQRARHQRTGSRLERNREVEKGASGAADRLGHGDPGQPHLGHRRGLLGELRRRVALRLRGPPGCPPSERAHLPKASASSTWSSSIPMGTGTPPSRNTTEN